MIEQIIDCKTGEIVNVDSETGFVVEVIQEATTNGEEDETI